MSEILRLRDADPVLAAGACAEVLERGGMVILPTDTVYGLAARVDRPGAVEAIFAAKGRDAVKALVVMVASTAEAEGLAIPGERETLRLLGSAFWPGPLTLVVDAGDTPWRESVASGSSSLGIRVPDSPFLLRLLEISGPLAVTSANPSGKRAPVSFDEVDAGLLAAAGLAVDGGECGSGEPSTVAAIGGKDIEVLRQGEITLEELRVALSRKREERGRAQRERTGRG